MAAIAGTPADTEAVQPLRDQVRAQVVTAADEGYDEARAVHNGMFDRRPLAVVKAEQVADVIAAVHFARERALGDQTRDRFGRNDTVLLAIENKGGAIESRRRGESLAH